MRTPQPQRQAIKLTNVFPRVIVIKPFFTTHGLACGRNGARRAESPEEIECRESGDCAARSYSCCADAGKKLDQGMSERLDYAVGLREHGAWRLLVEKSWYVGNTYVAGIRARYIGAAPIKAMPL